MYLLAAIAASGALLSQPSATCSWDRRATLQAAGGMVAAASFSTPTPAHASTGGNSQKRFEDIRDAFLTSLSSASPLASKFSSLARVNLKDDPGFLFTAPNVCKTATGTGRFVSVRLWRPTGGGDVRSILESFETRFAKEKQKPDGFRCYYGAVVLDEEVTSQYALLANVVDTREQAELINAKVKPCLAFVPNAPDSSHSVSPGLPVRYQELALVKKKLVRADLTVAPTFASSTLEAKLGGCVDPTFVEVID